MQSQTVSWLVPLLVGILGGGALLGIAALLARRVIRGARDAAREFRADARREAESKAKEILVAAQEKALSYDEEADRRDRELESRETALEDQARKLDRDSSTLGRQRKDLERRNAALARSEEEIRKAHAQAENDREEARETLERIAGLSSEEARQELIRGIEQEARREASRLARKIEDEARETAERQAVNLVVQATQRVNLRKAVQNTVTFIELPSDEMKGRIIGREGRNIRALEAATGIDLIVDDTPRSILISCFDPIRREIARVAIERLIEDGRIHPARIEDVVERVQSEIAQLIETTGGEAAFELGVSDLHPRLMRLIGRMKYRTYHGQNLLQHCVEVALLAGHMAGEVGGRVEVARRAAVLHEVGRVYEESTGHTILASAELAGKYGESEEVVQTIQSLHPDVAPKTLEAILLRTADRLSNNRPGARKENLEIFIERLRRLEEIASRFPGVDQAYAVKAGKEIRVVVDTKKVNDELAHKLAKDIAHALEQDLSFPGSIKVSVIRETRSVQFAV